MSATKKKNIHGWEGLTYLFYIFPESILGRLENLTAGGKGDNLYVATSKRQHPRGVNLYVSGSRLHHVEFVQRHHIIRRNARCAKKPKS